MLARDRAEIVLTQLRIRESLRSALEAEAKQNQVSVNKEITRRLEESLEGGAKLELAAITDGMTAITDRMETAWFKFEDRFLKLELEEGILKAIENGDLGTAREGVRLLRKNQAEVARWRARWRTFAPTVEVAPAETKADDE